MKGIDELDINGFDYRVCKQNFGYGWSYSIREVYYDSNGDPIAWTGRPDSLESDCEKDLKSEYNHMAEAFVKPVLDITSFEAAKKSNKPEIEVEDIDCSDVHSCHAECPCHEGKEPVSDFVGGESAN